MGFHEFSLYRLSLESLESAPVRYSGEPEALALEFEGSSLQISEAAFISKLKKHEETRNKRLGSRFLLVLRQHSH